MRAGALSAEKYASALLDQAEAKQNLNVFISFNREQVQEAAREADQARAKGHSLGLLHGVPIPIKDSVLTADYPTTAGSRALQNLTARQDAEIVKRLKASGSIVMGKTNMHELSAGYTSDNESFGAVRNPYNPFLVAGGSSGGTAAAIASGMSPVGIAEDTGGSVRVPAALCGIVGFRPTTGRYPTTEVVPMTPAFDQIGPEARTVTDIVLMDAILANRSGAIRPRPLETVRLGVLRGYLFEQVEPEVTLQVEQTLNRLRDAGATLVEVKIDSLQLLLEQTFRPVLMFEWYQILGDFLSKYGFQGNVEAVIEQAGPQIRKMFDQVARPGAPGAIRRDDYDNAIHRARPTLRKTVMECLKKNGLDALVFPTMPCVATPVGATKVPIDGTMLPIAALLGRNTLLAPCAGLPGLTLPAGLSRHGLPVGIEFEAAPGEDEALLSLGLGIEQALSRSGDPVVY